VSDENKTYSQEEVDALLAEQVGGLKANRDEALKEAKKAKDALKNYEGVDPAEFKALKEAAAEAERKKAAAEGDFKSLEKQLIERHQTELGTKEKRISKLQTALEKRLVDAKLATALAKADADPTMLELLQLAGRRAIRVRETEDDFEEYVADAQGNPLIADSRGTPMDVDTYVQQTLKAQYPGAFKGTGSSGGGATKSTGGASGAVRNIASTNSSDFLSNLDGIAAGKVKIG
jgi:chromosome segregation ATPase